MTAWTRALDAFEQRIADQREALDRGEAGEIPPFEPPQGLGPLPASLSDRAGRLLAEARDVEEELRGALAFLGQDIAVVRKVNAATGRPAGARFVDTSL